MPMPKLDGSAKSFFDEVVPADPRVRVKPMFGAFAAFYDDQMFLGCFGTQVFVRLSEADRKSLHAQTGSVPFEPMAGKPMREYLCLPQQWKDEPRAAAVWIERSLAYVGRLPPKAKKAKKAPAIVRSKGAAKGSGASAKGKGGGSASSRRGGRSTRTAHR